MYQDKWKRVIQVFDSHYQEIPLETLGKDPYKVLVSTVLSSRTKDEVSLKVSKKLFKIAPTFERLSKLDKETISKIIYPVGFYKTKALYLKKLSKIIIKKHQGNVPKSFEELVLLPGVGRKTANLVLNRAFGIPAIAVDIHVHRISNLLGLVRTNNPQKTEEQLKKVIPKKYWSKVNKLFVSIGRQYRSPKKLHKFLEENGLI